MHLRVLAAVAALAASAPAADVAAQQQHLNPLVDLHAAKQPVFGLYAPANTRGRGGRDGGGDAAEVPAQKPPRKTSAELAQDAVAFTASDYLFEGGMEGNFDAGYASFSEYMKGMAAAVPAGQRLRFPFMVKTHRIAEDPALAAARIGRQLNLGVAGIVFVGVEGAEEVRAGLAAMRFKSRGGTRPDDDLGDAPAYWGLSPQQYRDKADLWPLNPRGELVNWTIVESREGLAHVREIAAVPGIGALFPGAGTLRQVFSTTDSTGRRVTDDKAWEDAIQQVLAACKEFNVPCGFPANTPEVLEERYKQGFRVFVIAWGDTGFRTVDAGRKLSGR